MTLNQARSDVLLGLMRRYKERVPDVSTIIKEMVELGLVPSPQFIINDHIAFRTLGVPHLGIASLEKIFLAYGYVKKDYYRFDKKKLDAYWYAPPHDAEHLPRVFISQLCVNELTDEAQRIIYSYVKTVTSDPVDALELSNGEEVDHFLHHPLWAMPTWEDYSRLAQESEYASWVILNRYYLNHFTISVHDLPDGFNTIEKFNQFLISRGIILNSAGGEIKTSEDGLLIQSSTVAQLLDVEFPLAKGGTCIQKIPGSYVEFAERKVLPKFQHIASSRLKRDYRRDGFEAGNADKIFESTYLDQTKKRHD